jgi:serine/threonine protein kinase
MQNQDRNGEQFGRYRLVRLLGRGSFADVYLGEDLTSQAQYALKLFGIELTEAEIEDFHNTVSLPMQFPGSPVVELRELGVVGKTPFLAMHYAPGGTLREVMRQHTRPAPEVILPYIKRIAGALQRFHEKKLVYGETWPENILLEGNGEIKLGDCGITAMIWKLRPAFRNALTGRINYMAPEQIQGWVYPGSDQYALGVIVYEWLTGDLPFTGSVPEVREKQRFQPPPPLRDRQPEIAGDIEAVVLKALAKSPDARFASIQEFAAAFENACLSTQDGSHGG